MASKAVDYQTNAGKKEINAVQSNTLTKQSKIRYQMNMFTSVQYINTVLIALYLLIFAVLHVLMLHQYWIGVKRDEIADSVWLTVFFAYPYLIGLVERVIYDGFGYMLSLVYGQAYVSNFDKLFVRTDFYKTNTPETPANP